MAIIINSAGTRYSRETYEEIRKIINNASANGMPLIELHILKDAIDVSYTKMLLSYANFIEVIPQDKEERK
jgi:hypothetical protein